jgi:hypothetical protein
LASASVKRDRFIFSQPAARSWQQPGENSTFIQITESLTDRIQTSGKPENHPVSVKEKQVYLHDSSRNLTGGTLKVFCQQIQHRIMFTNDKLKGGGEAPINQGIFISYRRADSAFFAAHLRDRLEESFKGLTFIDVAGIAPGADFVEVIAATLEKCRAVIAVIGDGWSLRADSETGPDDLKDYVAYELETALAHDITVIPVLVEDAPVPEPGSLPPALRSLTSCNAIRISHARFDSDIQYLVNELYGLLGIRPPTGLEKLFGLFSNAPRVDEPVRHNMAQWSLWLALAGSLWCIVWFTMTEGPEEDITIVSLPLVAIALGLIGINSSRQRKTAILGLAISTVTLLFGIIILLFRSELLVDDPWLENLQLASSDIDIIPAESLYWSRQLTFAGPVPSTSCDCLILAQEPKGQIPYSDDVTAVFRNDCADATYFVVTRMDIPEISPAFVWVEGLGHEYAHITLQTGQSVQVALGGTFSWAFLPWTCGVRVVP